MPSSRGELGQLRIGPQIGALDIDMRDAAPLAGEDLVARPHDMLAGAQFDLPRPGEIRQQLGDIDRAAGERRRAARSSATTRSSPIGLSPIAPAGIGVGWLFCTHRITRSPGAGAGSPA